MVSTYKQSLTSYRSGSAEQGRANDLLYVRGRSLVACMAKPRHAHAVLLA